jgi:hypothetical protein
MAAARCCIARAGRARLLASASLAAGSPTVLAGTTTTTERSPPRSLISSRQSSRVFRVVSVQFRTDEVANVFVALPSRGLLLHRCPPQRYYSPTSE